MFQRGHIEPWWDTSYQDFNYQYLPQRDLKMVSDWHDQGYRDMNLNGAICELRDTEFARPFLDYFKWKNSGAALYKMNTGDVIPVHQDHYMTYRRVFEVADSRTIWRAIVFMDAWHSGHYFEIAGVPVTQWRAGDYVLWNYDTPHMAANIGLKPRYTLQVTGQIV